MRSRLSLQLGAGGSSDASISTLFANGEKGAWYDPSDFVTMFQDSAGTIPVTDFNQPVGKILDKSGNGFHLTQSTATSKPILKKDASGNSFLEFDGADDFLTCASFNMSSRDDLSIFACSAKYAEASAGIIVELSDAMGLNNGTFGVFYPTAPAAYNVSGGSKGTVSVFPAKTGILPSTTPRSIIFLADISAPSAGIRVDDLSEASSAASQGTGNYGNYSIYVGRRAGTSLPFYGSIYSLIIRNKLSTELEIADAKTYIKQKGGI